MAGLFSIFKRKQAPDSNASAQLSTPETASADPKGAGQPPSSQPESTPQPEPPSAPPVKRSFFQHIRHGLTRTREQIGQKLGLLFPGLRKMDEGLLEELEDLLLGTDLGYATTRQVLDRLARYKGQDLDEAGLRKRLAEELAAILAQVPETTLPLDLRPSVFLIVGVNGVGKTTTIGKLAHLWKQQGKRVLIGAADTFRAAAAEQLEVWAKRAQADIEIKENAADPAAVVFDALQRLRREGQDILLIDTAGRLHNKANLMNELAKIRRIIEREIPGAPHRTLLILDAVTGQNGLQQARQFVEKLGVTDLILTKMDGTAKGGVAVAIAGELRLPIQYIGVGEQLDQLLPFDRVAFLDSMLGQEG